MPSFFPFSNLGLGCKATNLSRDTKNQASWETKSLLRVLDLFQALLAVGHPQKISPRRLAGILVRYLNRLNLLLSVWRNSSSTTSQFKTLSQPLCRESSFSPFVSLVTFFWSLLRVCDQGEGKRLNQPVNCQLCFDLLSSSGVVTHSQSEVGTKPFCNWGPWCQTLRCYFPPSPFTLGWKLPQCIGDYSLMKPENHIIL